MAHLFAGDVAPWLGGKRNLAKRITAILDATPHSTYAEPFVGIGGIFLRRRMRPRSEVINDVPEIRDIFAGFEMTEVETSYTIGKQAASRTRRRELLIRNRI